MGHDYLNNKKALFYRSGLNVRGGRLELPHPLGHQILSLARLPIPPSSQIAFGI